MYTQAKSRKTDQEEGAALRMIMLGRGGGSRAACLEALGAVAAITSCIGAEPMAAVRDNIAALPSVFTGF